MYAYISGKLVEKTAATAVVDSNGIGYLLHIPVSTFAALPPLGTEVKMLAHFVVREDIQALYGFYTEEERQLFRLLLSVSGVGPKSALTVLSGIPIVDFKRAVIEGNLAVLTGVPGIGRKTAERLVVELREKIVLDDKKITGSAITKMQAQDDLIEDSLRALEELGYKKQNAQEAVRKAVKTLEAGKYSVPDLIRASLKYVS
jgi:holliday junction DNA helicase RuvA